MAVAGAGTVFRQTPCFSPNTGDASSSKIFQSRALCVKRQQPNRKLLVSMVGSVEFSDKSHLQYYNGVKMAMKEKEMTSEKKEMTSQKKEMKKKLKLLKGLSKNLNTFSEMGFGLNLDNDNGLDREVKIQMISEATEVLLGQLQKLKAEEMEAKRKKKEEKSKKKAAQMKEMMSSSSSSSESSSDSDCDTVVTTTQLKTHQEPPLKSSTPPLQTLENSLMNSNCSVKFEEKTEGSRIEVCMGGKCKKSGGAELLERFQTAVGGEAVVGCKCMGKCRDGPNVKVRSGGDGVGVGVGVGVGSPLCIGVGVEDVEMIVAKFFGGREVMVPALV